MNKKVLLFLALTSILTACSSQAQEEKSDKSVDEASVSTSMSQVNESNEPITVSCECSSEIEETSLLENSDSLPDAIEPSSTKDLWSSAKSDKLREVIDYYNHYNDMSNVELAPDKNVEFFDHQFPEYFFEEGALIQPSFNDIKLDLEWSSTGRGEKVDQLVAVYSDPSSDIYEQRSLILFIIRDGKGLVLISYPYGWTENSVMHFNVLPNNDIQELFQDIINQ